KMLVNPFGASPRTTTSGCGGRMPTGWSPRAGHLVCACDDSVPAAAAGLLTLGHHVGRHALAAAAATGLFALAQVAPVGVDLGGGHSLAAATPSGLFAGEGFIGGEQA